MGSPLPASHFRCRFVCEDMFCLSLFVCVCLSFGGANRAPESACTFGVIASPTCIKTSTRLTAIDKFYLSFGSHLEQAEVIAGLTFP